MSRRLLSRAVVALAVPALTITALSAPAEAAKAPKVPSITKVAKIYPHLAGGTVYTGESNPTAPPKKCGKEGKKIKGASGVYASYDAVYDPAVGYTPPSGAAPSISIQAMKFKTTAAAVKYLHGSGKTIKCNGGGVGDDLDIKTKIKKFSFKLGDERSGYTATSKFPDGDVYVSQSYLVRDGKFIVSAYASSSDGTAPSKKTGLKLIKMALKTAS